MSEKVLEVIGTVLVALVTSAGVALAGIWAWLATHKESDAKAKKTATEDHVLADKAAFEILLKTSTYLSEQLATRDRRISDLEKKIQEMTAERDKLICDNQEVLRKYETFKTSIIKIFDAMITEISRLEKPLVDTVKVIEIIKQAKEKLPKTGPLG